eukprot:5423119-Karenia_brevis.AAC.1
MSVLRSRGEETNQIVSNFSQIVQGDTNSLDDGNAPAGRAPAGGDIEHFADLHWVQQVASPREENASLAARNSFLQNQVVESDRVS